MKNTAGTPGKHRDFGGIDHGDDQAALLNPGIKQLTLIVQDDTFREFEFRQYIFACQAKVGYIFFYYLIFFSSFNYYLQILQRRLYFNIYMYNLHWMFWITLIQGLFE